MVRFASLVLAGLLVTGCGHSIASRKNDEKATIRGKVFLNGEPMEGGMLTFVSHDGKTQKASIFIDGTYFVGNVEPGLTKVIVNGEDVQRATQGKRPPKKLKLPEQYLAAETTPVSFTAIGGRQEKDFELQIDKAELDRLNAAGSGNTPSKDSPAKTTEPEKDAPAKIPAPGKFEPGERSAPEKEPEKGKVDPPKKENPKK